LLDGRISFSDETKLFISASHFSVITFVQANLTWSSSLQGFGRSLKIVVPFKKLAPLGWKPA